MIHRRRFINLIRPISIWLALLLTTGCAQTTPPVVATPQPPQPPIVQTVEVEVTRVVYREMLVTPTPAPPHACSPETIASANEVVIGALLPLSYPGAWMRSAHMQMGLSLALERVNSAGVAGKPLRLAVYDSGDDPARSAQLAQQLITEECAVALIVGLGDMASAAVAEVTEKFGKPMIVIDAAATQLTETMPPTLFRLAPASPMVASMPASWLADVGDYNKDGVVRAVAIVENSPAGDIFVEQNSQWFEQLGIEAAFHRIDLPMVDFSPEIARLLAMPEIPDAVYIVIGSDSALDLHQQLFEAGIRPEKGTLVVNQSRRALEPGAFGLRAQLPTGSIVARRGPWHTTAPEMGRQLFERFRQNGLTLPELSAFLAHDALLLLIDAMQRAPTLTSADLITALESSDIELAAGRYTFPFGVAQPLDGNAAPAYAWHQWMTPPLLYLMVTAEGQPPSEMRAIWPEAYRGAPQPVMPS